MRRPGRKIDEQAGHVCFAQYEPNGRHQDVRHERRHDLAERRADDECDREVEDIPAHGERLEFLQHGAPEKRVSGRQ